METLIVFVVSVGLGYVARMAYEALRAVPKNGSPWRRDVVKWWGQNEELILAERERHEQGKSDIARRIEPYSALANQGQRDTPPHELGGRHAPSVTLRQPGAGPEGRDAATSGHYRVALVLDETARPALADQADADLIVRCYADKAWVGKDIHGVIRWVSPIEAERLVGSADLVHHVGNGYDERFGA